MKRILPIAILMLILSVPLDSFGYEKLVHEKITARAITDSNLATYLDGLNLSLKNDLDKRKVDEWIIKGSAFEDGEYEGPKLLEDLISATVEEARYTNHFYDPTTGKGLNDTVQGYALTGLPSLQWAKDSSANDYSWKKARLYFIDALTNSASDNREESFALLFRSLGQVMHLVQDKSVPAHVRNDSHGLALNGYDMYEKYTASNNLTYTGYPVVSNATFNTVESFWDTNTGLGLAEFANRNFVSRDTNFNDVKYQNYNMPVATGSWWTTEQVPSRFFGIGTEEVKVRYSKGYVTDYYKGETSRTIDKLAAYSYFDYEMKLHNIMYEVYSLNSKVHKEYADFLIPRAVGYSAGLLNYFFRGQMETSALEQKDIDGNISGLLVNVKNITAGETMNDGSFVISYRYKPCGSSEYLYRFSDPLTSGILAPNQPSVQYAFVFPLSIPAGATDIQYILVFNGTLGMETGAVVGKVVPVTQAHIDITHPDRFLYAIEGVGNSSAFNKLRARLRNNTQGIDMAGGSVTARVRYKLHLNHMNDLSTEPPFSENRSSDFHYSSSLPVSLSLDNLNYMQVEFDFSSNPIPFGVTDLSLEVTYRKGNIVIADSVKDLNEPQYIGVWNSHDRFLIDVDINTSDDIHEWRLLTEAEIMGDPVLVNMLDYDNHGLVDEPIDAMNVNFDLYFSAAPLSGLPTTYHATFNNLPPGRYGRVAVITDQPYFYVKFHEKYTSSIEDASGTGNYLGYDGNITYVTPGVTNQEKEGAYYYTQIYSFRNVPNHFSYITLGMYPEPATILEKGILIKDANWPEPVDNAPYPAASINP